MILLVHTVKQETDTEKSGRLGYSADSKLSSKKSRCPKETNNTVTGQVLATEYFKSFSQNTFMVGRNEIHRSYPILSYHFYPGLLAIIVP